MRCAVCSQKSDSAFGRAGFEAEARQLRYEVLEEEARKAAADAILTAHHLDDQLETFLIQWMRGSGPAGLAAMPPLLRKDRMHDYASAARVSKDRTGTFLPKFEVSSGSKMKVMKIRNILQRDSAQHHSRTGKDSSGIQTAAARSIELIAEAAETLRDVAEDDFNQASENDGKYLRIDDF